MNLRLGLLRQESQTYSQRPVPDVLGPRPAVVSRASGIAHRWIIWVAEHYASDTKYA